MAPFRDDEGVVEQSAVQIYGMHRARSLVGREKAFARGKEKMSHIPVRDLAYAGREDLVARVHPAAPDEAYAGTRSGPQPSLTVGAKRADEIVRKPVLSLVEDHVCAAVVFVQAADGTYPDIAVGVFDDAGDVGTRQPGLARLGRGICLAAEHERNRQQENDGESFHN